MAEGRTEGGSLDGGKSTTDKYRRAGEPWGSRLARFDLSYWSMARHLAVDGGQAALIRVAEQEMEAAEQYIKGVADGDGEPDNREEG